MRDDRVAEAARLFLAGAQHIVTPSAEAAAALAGTGADVVVSPLRSAASPADAVALITDEISTAGEHAEGLIADAVAAVAPGGRIVVTAQGIFAPGREGRSYRSDELRRALGHHGVDVEVIYAPGAARIAAGDPDGGFDPDLDRLPGLLDAAPRLVACGRTARSAMGRSNAFFETLPYKVVAAGVLCRDEHDRLLTVHDSFKGHWTIPGGVVDADEDPRLAAEREAWEEAGVRVTAGAVLGVFSASWPDRVVLVYDARPVAGAEHSHTPLHAHEIDGVEWVPVAEALRRLAPHIAEQVRFCLEHPGGTLRQRRA